MPAADHAIQRLSIEGLRSSDINALSVLIPDAMRQHVERLEPGVVADLFALCELGLAGALGADLAAWNARARREIKDMPDGSIRATFVAELAELPPEQVPATLRDLLKTLAETSGAAVSSAVAGVSAIWAETTPATIILTQKKVRATSGRTPASTAAADARAGKPAPTPKTRVARTPAAQVDPRRAEWVREDAVVRLNSREYQERGLKESIFIAGIKHRSPYKDITEEEIKTELRKLERERKLKHTGERWTAR